MTVIVYKCTVCDRELEKVQNKKGLDIVNRCTVTDGCRGTMYQIDIKLDYIRGKFPEAVSGLDDWSQRNILFNHIQSIPSHEWKIEHGMGVEPTVQVHLSIETSTGQTRLVETTPKSIDIINENELIVSFDIAQKGQVQCIARSSKPVVPIVNEVIVDTSASFQLTTDSEFSFATIEDMTNIDLKMTFLTPDGRTVDVDYVVDDQPSIKSPWVGTDKLYIRGNVYTTRSFNISDGVSEFSDGTVTDGSVMFIKSINNNLLVPTNILALLAYSPYAVQDRNVKQLIDLSKVDITNAARSFVYNKGDIVSFSSLIENIYPHIRSV